MAEGEVQEVLGPDPSEQLSRANHVGDGLADALEEARRCEWSYPSPAEREAIVANADEWLRRAHELRWGAARGLPRVVGSGHDEQTELQELRAVLHRNGRPETAAELQADFERRRERAIRDWAPYVGHSPDGKPIYHEDTVAAVVEFVRTHSGWHGAGGACGRSWANLIEQEFGSSVSGGES